MYIFTYTCIHTHTCLYSAYTYKCTDICMCVYYVVLTGGKHAVGHGYVQWCPRCALYISPSIHLYIRTHLHTYIRASINTYLAYIHNN